MTQEGAKELVLGGEARVDDGLRDPRPIRDLRAPDRREMERRENGSSAAATSVVSPAEAVVEHPQAPTVVKAD